MLANKEVISESVRTSHEASAVWEVMKNPASIELWHPGIVSAKLENGVREVSLESGAVIVERITAADDRQRTYSYAYVSGPLEMSGFTSQIIVSPSGSGQSEVSWSASFDKGDSSAETAGMVAALYRAGLTGLQEYLDTVLGTVRSGEAR
ncbi:SRPBCC family protein [Nocardia vaccinii]|uniref:SRPBCC family protein n=1 Tax=Nocardia vaccinii TaxID=1822 RepID=UPI00083093BB|nr:SRPBCC family protein [Nocardia vaccinii]